MKYKLREDPNQVTDFMTQDLRLRTVWERGYAQCGTALGRYKVYQLRNDVAEWVSQQDITKWTRYEVEFSYDVYHFSDELMMLLILRWS